MTASPEDPQPDAVRLAKIELKIDLLSGQVTEMLNSMHSDGGLKARVRQLEEDVRLNRSQLSTYARWLWVVGTGLAVETVRRILAGM